MPIETETQWINQDGWVYRVRPPSAGGVQHPVLLMLHGWTGDENSMWIFARRLPEADWKLAPRAPIQAPGGGYGWNDSLPDASVDLTAYKPMVDRLLGWLDSWASDQRLDLAALDLLGFSQGAFMVYALGLLYPQRVRLSGALAGYLPASWLAQISPGAIQGKRYYLAHGTRDETIPVERARESARLLTAAGARVTYCEAPVGHKLSVNCLNGLEEFFRAAGSAPADQRDQPEKHP